MGDRPLAPVEGALVARMARPRAIDGLAGMADAPLAGTADGMADGPLAGTAPLDTERPTPS